MKNSRNNICVVAITRLGDMLQASPTFEGFKRENPNCKVTVVIDKQFARICTGLPGVDEVYMLDLSMIVRCLARGGDGVVEAYRAVDQMVRDLREKNFDYVLNMSSSPYTALMLKMIDAPENRGWMADEEGFRLITDPWAMLFAAFVFHSNREYNGMNLVDILRCSAGVREHPMHLVYTPTAEERETMSAKLKELGVPGEGPLVAIQAGASQEKRQWPPAHFAKLVQQLIEQLNARVLFVGASSEAWILEDVRKRYDHPKIFSAMGKTTFGELAAVLEQVDVLVTGDTGPMHMAVAVGRPVVALFLASALCFETGPYSAGNLVIQPQISCNPCNPNFPCARPDCHGQITPELVAHLVQLRLSTPKGSEASIKLAPQFKNQQEAAIYCTEFDEDGFLRFRLLGGAATREGEVPRYYAAARESYRALWKEEFDGIPYVKLMTDPKMPTPRPHPSLAGVDEAIELTNQGCALLDQLRKLVRDPSSPVQALKEVNARVQEIDKKIEEVGLSHPILGALIRIFLMEKENLRGDDILKLASETGELYSRLARRGKRFAHLFEHFEKGSIEGAV